MPQYQLNISFEQDDLPSILEANEKITIVKQTEDDSKIAWVTFSPFLHNTIKWEDNYALYCSNSEIQSGAVIDKLSDLVVSSGLTYLFNKGIFNNPYPDSSLPKNSYGVTNNMSDYKSLIFGLAQSVVINNTASPNHPINAVVVPYNHTSSFTPYETVEVYLEANIRNSMVMSATRSKMISVKFGGDVSQITLKYNKTTGEFYKL